MYFRIVSESFSRTPRRKLLTGIALALGMAVATATLTVALDVGDRLAEEFRSLGANLLVTPKADTLPLEVGGVDYRPVDAGAYLDEKDLPQLKKIFWRNNIKGFSPFLDVPGEFSDFHSAPGNSAPNSGATFAGRLEGTWVSHVLQISSDESFRTGTSITHPWWQIEEGRWFREPGSANAAPAECVVGETLARRSHIRVGDALIAKSPGRELDLIVVGISQTGGPEDDLVLAPLSAAQFLGNEPGNYRRLMVSALTKPEDAFARKDPSTMSGDEYDRWYCTAYVSSIALQITQVIPGVEARPIRQVAEGEGKILNHISALLWVVTLAALVAALLAVASTAASTVLERQREIGLMKALGASNLMVASLFLGEQLLLALAGGMLGYACGILLGRWLSLSVFGAAASARLILLPVTIALAIVVAFLGSAIPLRRAALFDPAPILRGE
jgi:putative ABC transport system permease protein